VKAKSITLTLKVLNQEGRSVVVVQELDVINASEQRQIVDFLQRTVAEAYEHATRDDALHEATESTP
jgi:hypothetical protein